MIFPNEDLRRHRRARRGYWFLRGLGAGLAGANSQGATVDELSANLQQVLELLVEDGEIRLTSEFIGTETVRVD